MVRIYQGACLPGALPRTWAAPRWLLMTREQCTTDHVGLFRSQSTKNIYLCSRDTWEFYACSILTQAHICALIQIYRSKHLRFHTAAMGTSKTLMQYLVFSESGKGHSYWHSPWDSLCDKGFICKTWCPPTEVDMHLKMSHMSKTQGQKSEQPLHLHLTPLRLVVGRFCYRLSSWAMLWAFLMTDSLTDNPE